MISVSFDYSIGYCQGRIHYSDRKRRQPFSEKDPETIWSMGGEGTGGAGKKGSAIEFESRMGHDSYSSFALAVMKRKKDKSDF